MSLKAHGVGFGHWTIFSLPKMKLTKKKNKHNLLVNHWKQLVFIKRTEYIMAVQRLEIKSINIKMEQYEEN